MMKKSVHKYSIVFQNINGLHLKDNPLIPRPLFISFAIHIQKHHGLDSFAAYYAYALAFKLPLECFKVKNNNMRRL